MKKNLAFNRILFAVLLIMFLVIIPNTLTGYPLMVVNIALIFAIATYGLSILIGMGGQLSFATVSFMGGGAYFVANLASGRLGFKLSTTLALILALVVFGVISFALGLILNKLKGTYFTFATIAVVQVAYTFYNNYKPLFGGPDGIAGIPSLSIFGFKLNDNVKWFYFLMFIVLIVGVIVERIRQTQLGRALASIRDNETAARTLGVNVYMTKVISFTIAGVLATLAGALYCYHGNFVSSDMYNFANSTQVIIMAMLGGVNSSIGIFIGALLVRVLPEIFRFLQSYMQLIWGITIIVLMVFMPDGLVGLFAQIKDKVTKLINNKAKEGAADETNIKA